MLQAAGSEVSVPNVRSAKGKYVDCGDQQLFSCLLEAGSPEDEQKVSEQTVPVLSARATSTMLRKILALIGKTRLGVPAGFLGGNPSSILFLSGMSSVAGTLYEGGKGTRVACPSTCNLFFDTRDPSSAVIEGNRSDCGGNGVKHPHVLEYIACASWLDMVIRREFRG